MGTHTLTLRVTDNAGESSTDTVLVTVNPPPNAPPSANAGADQTVTDSDGNRTQAVTLYGGASSDSDGTIVRYIWREGVSTMRSTAHCSFLDASSMARRIRRVIWASCRTTTNVIAEVQNTMATMESCSRRWRS